MNELQIFNSEEEVIEMRCNECGNREIKEEDNFCIVCGNFREY